MRLGGTIGITNAQRSSIGALKSSETETWARQSVDVSVVIERLSASLIGSVARLRSAAEQLDHGVANYPAGVVPDRGADGVGERPSGRHEDGLMVLPHVRQRGLVVGHRGEKSVVAGRHRLQHGHQRRPRRGGVEVRVGLPLLAGSGGETEEGVRETANRPSILSHQLVERIVDLAAAWPAVWLNASTAATNSVSRRSWVPALLPLIELR